MKTEINKAEYESRKPKSATKALDYSELFPAYNLSLDGPPFSVCNSNLTTDRKRLSSNFDLECIMELWKCYYSWLKVEINSSGKGELKEN